ncbi:MFS transporter [Nocardia higoensis]|uniref:MFS transporter n=1 Tax=Nocardia higoensis TaxID=228599 RepID=UPI000316CD1E|nr:MFS transporter [Nocardia higoensis]
MSEQQANAVRPWRVFAAASFGVVAIFINMSGLTVALPTIARELDASPAHSTAIVLGYMLVTTALILVFGRIADLVGRRPLYLAGIGLFTVATALCALSFSPWMLIAARVLQGVGAAAFVTNNTALLTDTFAPGQLGRALGWNATIAALAQVIGPVVGGVATAIAGWRGLFLLTLPFGLIALIASALVVPRAAGQRGAGERFDAVGAVLSTVALSAAVLALSADVPVSPWLSSAVALGAAAGFVAVQLRRPHPLVDVQLFRNRAVTLVLVAALLNAVATYATVIMISLYGQGGGLDPAQAGLLVVPIALGTVVAAAATGRLMQRFAPRELAAIGMGLNAIGSVGVALSLADDATTLWPLVPWLAVLGAGTGLFMTPSTSALMLTAPAQRRGIANGLRSTLQNVGYLFSSAIALAVATVGLDEQARRAAFGGTLSGVDTAQLATFVGNLRLVGLLFAAISVLGLIVCLFFPRRGRMPALVVADSAPETTGVPETTARR